MGSLGMSELVKVEAGNFFAERSGGIRCVPDVALLSMIWSEEQRLTIRTNWQACDGARRGAGLLIVESALRPGNAFHPGKMTDMIMLTVPGGG